jgi:hypothetical protein
MQPMSQFCGKSADDDGRGPPAFAHPAMLPMAIRQSLVAKMAWFATKMGLPNPATASPNS